LPPFILLDKKVFTVLHNILVGIDLTFLHFLMISRTQPEFKKSTDHFQELNSSLTHPGMALRKALKKAVPFIIVLLQFVEDLVSLVE
jgi:hypothetical protein